MFDGVKIRRISGKIFKGMSGRCNSRFYIGTLMKGGIVHDDNRVFRQFGQQITNNPSIKNIRINICFK